VVSSAALAAYLARDEATRPDGFVLEGASAGGHNAPPRGRLTLDEQGQPRYGPRDEIDLDAVTRLGLPSWLAGGYGTPSRLREALAAGATGVQVGTIFALSRESGLADDLRESVRRQLALGGPTVRTDPSASPTGFPFKVAQLQPTLADQEVYESRQRLCDLGYLRTPYLDATGRVGYRCPAEPQHMYLRKGGSIEDTVGRKCLCNALTANVGLGQTRRSGYAEPALVTLGSDLEGARELARRHPDGWTAADAIAWLTGASRPTESSPIAHR
jgi:NAD(P)H-dependent flavin oxidoreductase YrpB (nitropropane dioxygenase family)